MSSSSFWKVNFLPSARKNETGARSLFLREPSDIRFTVRGRRHICNLYITKSTDKYVYDNRTVNATMLCDKR